MSAVAESWFSMVTFSSREIVTKDTMKVTIYGYASFYANPNYSDWLGLNCCAFFGKGSHQEFWLGGMFYGIRKK